MSYMNLLCYVVAFVSTNELLSDPTENASPAILLLPSSFVNTLRKLNSSVTASALPVGVAARRRLRVSSPAAYVYRVSVRE